MPKSLSQTLDHPYLSSFFAFTSHVSILRDVKGSLDTKT